MKIGLMSDSHTRSDYARVTIEKLIKQGAQYLVHAGDIGTKETLQDLKESGLPYVSVIGNNDFHLLELVDHYRLVKEPYYFKIENLKCKLMHMPYFLTPDTDVVIYGHTHHFEYSYSGNALFINPGEICAREKPVSECALLEVNDQSFHIHRYYRTPEDSHWQEELHEQLK